MNQTKTPTSIPTTSMSLVEAEHSPATEESSNVQLPVAHARFDDAHPRMLLDQNNEFYDMSVWYMDTELHPKITQPLCFLITLRPDGLGLCAEPDVASWELMKHRGGKRLIEIAAKNATSTMMFNTQKDLASDLVRMTPVPKGFKRPSNSIILDAQQNSELEAPLGEEGSYYDPSSAEHACPMRQMAMVLTNGPVWLPPAPTARVRGWGTQSQKEED